MSVEISKPDCKEKKDEKDKSCEIIIKGVTYMRNTRKTNKRARREEIFEAVMTHHF